MFIKYYAWYFCQIKHGLFFFPQGFTTFILAIDAWVKTNQVGKFEIGKSRDIPNWATKENSKRKDNAEQISERLVRRLRILFFLRILGRPFIPEKSMFILLTLWKMHDDFSIVSLHYDLSMYFLIFFFIPA